MIKEVSSPVGLLTNACREPKCRVWLYREKPDQTAKKKTISESFRFLRACLPHLSRLPVYLHRYLKEEECVTLYGTLK